MARSTLHPRRPLPRQAATSYTLTIEASDSAGNAATTDITVTLVDATDPTITAASPTVDVPETTSTGTVIHTVAASDNFAVTSFSSVPFPDRGTAGMFSIDDNGSTDRGLDNDAASTAATTITVPVTVSDAAGNTATANVIFNMLEVMTSSGTGNNGASVARSVTASTTGSLRSRYPRTPRAPSLILSSRTVSMPPPTPITTLPGHCIQH